MTLGVTLRYHNSSVADITINMVMKKYLENQI